MTHLANHPRTCQAAENYVFIGFTVWVIGAEVDGVSTCINAVYFLRDTAEVSKTKRETEMEKA